MIRTTITLAMPLCATAAEALTVIEKLCIVTAAQDLKAGATSSKWRLQLPVMA
jgi:hypothetical protein